MGSTRMWILLFVAQLVTLGLLAALGPVTAATPALRYVGYVCLAGIFACVPPIMVKLFVAGQIRVGNGELSMVRALQQHETIVIVSVWAMIAVALAMAMPQITRDIRADREAAGIADAHAVAPAPVPPASAASMSAPPVEQAVSTPGPGSPQRAAILDALRKRLKISSRFKIDHIRVASNWAFVRATEVVELEKGELQETDLTVSALLELPEGSTTGWWRIADMWTLPGEQEQPLAEFTRRVRARQRAERLPDALFPDDLLTDQR